MVVAKRQGREKPAKLEQRKIPGLEWGPQVEQTEDPRTGVRTSGRTNSTPGAQFAEGRPRGREKHIKGGGQRARALSRMLMRMCTLSLFLSLSLFPPPPRSSLFASFGSSCPHVSRMYFPLFK